MKEKGKKRRSRAHIYVVIVLIAASFAILLSTLIIYRNSLGAADEALRLQALGIAASLEPSLQTIKGKELLFSEINTSAAWEGIAYIALYDSNGKTLLHSNETMIGRVFDLPEIRIAAKQNKIIYEYMTLLTDEEVFVMNYPIAVGDSVNVLRIALHPYPAQDIVRQATFQIISVSFIVVFLWTIGFFLVRAVRKSDELTVMMAERERLAAIGEMAAVLAHEIRNPLGSIKGFAQYLAEGRKGGDEELNVIINEAVRLERLTGDLLLFARPAEPKAETFSLSGLIKEITASARASELVRRNSISLTASTSGDLIISTDKSMLRQILSNIVQNALEATGEKGIVGIAAEQKGDSVIIAVSDDGCGMDEETVNRAFDSFFTTKAKGSGLGLAIVSRLIKAINGIIDIQSSVGHGTVVSIILPAGLNEGHE
jgi:two-component system, NtrC family, sensor histidine kinase HydH